MEFTRSPLFEHKNSYYATVTYEFDVFKTKKGMFKKENYELFYFLF